MEGMVRYCRACGEEFQPHVVRCADCGAELVDRWPGDDGENVEPTDAELPPEESEEAPERYAEVARQLLSEEAERAARRLTRAGITFRVRPSGFAFSISVRRQDVEAAEKALGRLGDRRSPPGPDGAVGQDGGPCPACGALVNPNSEECPDCGLGVGSRPACPDCEAPLDELGEACARCGWRGGSSGE